MKMSNAVRTISTVAALKAWVRQLESQRVEEFSFLPAGALLARCPGGDVGSLVMALMPRVCSVHTTMSNQGGQLKEVRCRVTYHACVRMLDAWRSHSTAKLPAEELQAVQQAQTIVRSIASRRKRPIEQLYMLYSYVGATINYKAGDERTAEFRLLTSAAQALLRRIANCQGFAGVMYLLGGMLGFRMELQSGRSTAGGHMWNLVEVGMHRYAMDASAAAVARSQSRRMLTDYASFLMGRQEAAENGLTWTAEKETQPISASLAAGHDYYHASGTAFTTVDAAAREIWRRRLAGEKLTHVRIRGSRALTLEDLTQALHRVGEEPAMNREIFSRLTGKVGYSLLGNSAGKALYASVEWQ